MNLDSTQQSTQRNQVERNETLKNVNDSSTILHNFNSPSRDFILNDTNQSQSLYNGSENLNMAQR